MIIFINGSINSGKSTISKLLQKSMPKSAVVEVDSLRAFIDWMPLEQAIPINLKNAVSIIKNFVSDNIDVIVPYPLSQANYQFFTSEFAESEQKLKFITLAPKLETALKNRGRELSKQEQERIKYHYEIGIHTPSFGISIDTSDQTPEQTVELILEYLNHE